MTAERDVGDHLRRAQIPFAVIGATAMSVHGFARQTLDFDLLTTDASVLTESFWDGFPGSPNIRRGDANDPLRGVVRFHDPEIDLVVGRWKWQAEIVERAQPMKIEGVTWPVVLLGDLILLKLDAGGYRDAADVKMMIERSGAKTREYVERHVTSLDERAQGLWGEVSS